MKSKWFKLLIVILIVTFNILSILILLHVQTKLNNNHDEVTINEICFNENYLSDEIKNFKLVKEKNNRYSLIDMNYDFDSLIDMLKNEDDSIQDKIDRMKEESTKKHSSVYYEDMIDNYMDVFGMSLEGEMPYIEIYNKEKVLRSNIYLNTYNDIEKLLGKGTIFKYNEGRFDYYILTYTYKDIIVDFISFYEDGKSSSLIIRKYI
ncbi:MAG: hypothetical protein MJ245_07500 [Clostridia bacterium]|nr:hypothetical protein [Clostridia bacterium]